MSTLDRIGVERFESSPGHGRSCMHQHMDALTVLTPGIIAHMRFTTGTLDITWVTATLDITRVTYGRFIAGPAAPYDQASHMHMHTHICTYM